MRFLMKISGLFQFLFLISRTCDRRSVLKCGWNCFIIEMVVKKVNKILLKNYQDLLKIEVETRLCNQRWIETTLIQNVDIFSWLTSMHYRSSKLTVISSLQRIPVKSFKVISGLSPIFNLTGLFELLTSDGSVAGLRELHRRQENLSGLFQSNKQQLWKYTPARW